MTTVASPLGTMMPLDAPTNFDATAAKNNPKPFFLMDWLEDLVADQDVHRLAEMLQTPNKKEQKRESRHYDDYSHLEDAPPTPKSSNRKRIQARMFKNGIEPTRLFGIKSTSACSLSYSSLSSGALSSVADSQGSGPPTTQRSPVRSSSKASLYKKSLALGNGWNAKGLKKAQQGLWQDALACWDHALEIRLPLLGKVHLEVANTYNNRGIALSQLGTFDEALSALETALEVRIPLLGPHHSQVISTLHNIANVHQQAGHLQQALQVFGQAKELILASTASDLLLMARVCTAMGHVYYQAQQWVDARDAYQDALQVYQEQDAKPPQALQVELQDLQRDIRDLDAKIADTRMLE